MTVRLESLRVTADMDVSQYVRAAQQKNAADAAMVASVRSVGQAMAATDAATAKLVPGMERLSRLWITGYGDAAKFEASIRQVGNALDKGMSVERAAVQLNAIYQKFGQVADATALATAGFVKLAPVVDAVNREFNEMAVAAAKADIAAKKLADLAQEEKELAAIHAQLTRSYDILGSAQTRHNEVVQQAARLRTAGKIDQQSYDTIVKQSSRVLEDTKNAYGGAYTAQAKFASGTGLARHELVNFSRQVQDIGVSLASGQSFMTVLIQQGTQVYDIFASSRGSVGGFFTQLASGAARVIPVLGGVAAAVAAVYASITIANDRQALSNSLLGSGQASGLTGGGLAALAQESAASANITVANSRLIAAEFVKLGAIARTNLPQLTKLTKDYAAVTGTDLPTAAKELASALADPARGAEMLGSKIGALDSSVIQAARTAGTFNERLDAMKKLMDAAGVAIEGAADRSMTKWDRLVKNVSTVYDKTKEAVAGAIIGPDSGEAENARLKQVETQLRRNKELLNNGTERSSFYNPDKIKAETKALEDEKATLEALQKTRQQVANDNASKTNNNAIINQGVELSKTYRALPLQLEEVEKNFKSMQEAVEKASSESTDSLQKLILQNGDVDSNMQNAGYLAKEKTFRDLALSARAAGQQLEELRGIEAAGGAESYKTGKLIELEAKYRGDNSLAAKASIAEQTTLINLSGTIATAEERRAAATAARNKVNADAQNANAEQLAALARTATATNNSANAYKNLGKAAGATAQGLAEVTERTRATGGDADKVFSAERAKRIADINVKLQENAIALEAANQAEARGNAQAKGASPAERQRIVRENKDLEEERQKLLAEGVTSQTKQNELLERNIAAKRAQVAIEKSGVGQDYITEQERALVVGEKQIAAIRLSRGARLEELEVMKAQEFMWQNGIDAETKKGKEILANARLLGKQNEQREIELKLQGQIRQAQDAAADSAKSFLSDMLTGTEGLKGALKNLGKGFLSSSLDALISGKGSLAGITGLASTTKDGQGGLLGLFTTGIQGLGKDVKDGAKEGVGEGVKDTFGGATTNLNVLSGLGIDGKQLAGGLTAIAGLAGAYGTGAAAGSYGQAVAGGAISGGVAGLAAASALGGVGLASASVLGPIGLIIGGALAYYGQKSARDAAKKQREEEAQANYKQAEPGIAVLRSQLRGEAQDTLENRIRTTLTEVQKGIDVAFFAKKTDEANALAGDYFTYKDKAISDFQRAFNGLVDSLEDGLGPNSAFAQARDSVKSTGDALKGFVSDAAYAFGKESEQVQEATEAARSHALSILDGAKTLSVVGTRMEEIRGAGVALQQLLVELGMSATDAADAIQKDTIAALGRLKGAFENDVNAQINDSQGYGYVNDFNKLFSEYTAKMSDAVALSSGVDLAEWFRGQAQAIVDGSQLAGEAFQHLIDGYPQLAGVITEFTNGLKGAAKQADIAARKLAAQDRLFNATNPTDTLGGQLAAYNRQAMREREAEIKAGSEAMAELEAAQAAERYNIIKAWNQKILDDQKAAADEAKSFWDRFAKQIKEYTDGLRAGAESPLSPQQRLAAAQSQYNAQLALAQGGDRDALGSITSYSSDFLDAMKAYYASSQQYQDAFSQVITQLEALPDQVTDTQLIIDAIDTGAQATVDEISIMNSALQVAVNSGSAQQIAAALSTYFNRIDTNTSNSIDFSEMSAALGGMANQSQLRDMFTRLDTDNSGAIQRDEAIRAASAGTTSAVNAQQNLLDAIRGFTQSTNINAASTAQASEILKANTYNAWQASINAQVSYSAMLNQLLRIGANTLAQAQRIYVQGNSGVAPGAYFAGGYTGNYGTRQEAGVVHGQEYVLNAEATRAIGIKSLDFMNDNGRVPNGGINMGALLSRLDAMSQEIRMLRREARDTGDYIASATATGAQHVRTGVDAVVRNTGSAARAERRQAAA